MVAVKTSAAFVDHMYEILGPLLCGANLLFIPREVSFAVLCCAAFDPVL